MYAEELLKSALVDSGLIPINKFRDACSHSKQHDKSIDRSLIELEITSARQLGEALCQQFLLPYQPVCAHPASAPVWKALSPESALSWGVYPSEVNEEEKILTIIVPHPERASFVEKELLLSTAKHTPAFCIASSTEIEDALEIIKNEIGPVQHMPIKDGPPKAATSPSIRKIEIPAENRPYKVRTSLSDASEEDPSGDDIKRIFRRPRIGRQAEPDKGISTYLSPFLTEVSQGIYTKFKSEPDALRRINEKVKYCSLMGSHMNMGNDRIQRTILAAWLSLYDKKEGIKRAQGREDIIDILTPPPIHRMPSLEQRIIAITERYLKIKNSIPADCLTQDLLRMKLQPAIMTGQDGELVLTTFFKLLKNERILTEAEEGNVVQGALTHLDLNDIIQILSASAKDICINLQQKKREGHIYMQKGKIINAQLEKMVGQEAFFEMLSWKAGKFKTATCKKFPKPNLEGDTMGLLMEAARINDERRI